MSKVLIWFARNRIPANLLMWLVVIAGALSIGELPIQVSGSDPKLGIVTISVAYPGANPKEVDEAVCVRINEAIQGLKTIKRVASTASEGLCYVQARLVHGADMRHTLDEIKTRIDTIKSLPEGVETPVVSELVLTTKILTVVLSGAADEHTLTTLGERTREGIAELPSVTLTELEGIRPYEISVELSEEALRRYGITFSQVVEAVRHSSLDLPGGSVKAREGEILLHTAGQAYRKRDFEDLVLFSKGDGSRVTLGTVATVSDGFSDTGAAMLFDGMPAVLIHVYRVGKQDVGEMTNQIYEFVRDARRRLPEGIEITIWDDKSTLLKDRLRTMLANGRSGLILVLLVLGVFLRFRSAFWVGISIPISFLGTLWGMWLLDLPVSLATLTGFLISLGIVVDDSLVVGESIHSRQVSSREGVGAAVEGVREVAGPVIFSVLTTIAAFAPLLALPGLLGEGFRSLAAVVIISLVFSLIESLLILPAHLAYSVPSGKERGTARRGGFTSLWIRAWQALGSSLDRFAEHVYIPFLERALAWRATAIAAAVALLAISLGVVASERVQFMFFQPVESDSITVGLVMPQGTPQNVTAASLSRISQRVEDLRLELARQGNSTVVRHVLTTIGNLPAGGIQLSGLFTPAARGAHLGGVTVELAPGGERDVSTKDLAARLRTLVGPIPDAVEISYSTSFLAAGKPIDIEISALEPDDLRPAARELRAALSRYPGAFDISDSLQVGKQEVRISATSEADALGIHLSELASQVRQAFYGEEVQRFQRGRDEVRVMVRYSKEQRRHLASLEEMRIRTPSGAEVPFAVAGRTEAGYGLAAIERMNGRRTVRVSANLDRAQSAQSLNQILKNLQETVLPSLLEAYPGLSSSFGGEQEEQREAVTALFRNTLLAFFAIFALLAVNTNSYLRPLLIMGAIPFGAAGAIWGHVIMGFPLTMWSLVGIVAVSGVVINDSLVLVSFSDDAQRAGVSIQMALRRAARSRFRPILLTSVTTFAGLAPLLSDESIQAKPLIPIAISLAFGVLSATWITLLLVPIGCSLLADAKVRPGQRPGAESEALPLPPA